MEPLQTAGLMPGPYKIEAMRYRTRGVATNKTPVGPYRAVGRPSASASLELLIDELGRRLNLDPVEIRQRNLIPLEAMPYRNANNLVHDNVNYLPCLKLAVAKAGYERLRKEQHEGWAPAPRLVPALCCNPAATPLRCAWKRLACSPSPRRCRHKASAS
jgi:carbon-monoxide dehydrogenase large subunit